MDDIDIWPQDALLRGNPQDRAARHDTQAEPPGLTPGWYPSPDGRRTLSWWTGRRWSRTIPHRPLPRDAPPSRAEQRVGRRWRRNVPLAIALSLAGGPLGSVYANWRVGAPVSIVTWLAVSNSQEPFPAFTYALLLPINAALAAHLAARHNERVDAREALRDGRHRPWRPADAPLDVTQFARIG